MWLEIGWLLCNLFQVPELWADFRGFLVVNSFPDLVSLNDSVIQWLGSPGCGGTLLGASSVARRYHSYDQFPDRCHHHTYMPGSTRSFHMLHLSWFVQQLWKQVGYPKVSYSPFYRVELNRISNLTDFPSSLSSELWSEVRCAVH